MKDETEEVRHIFRYAGKVKLLDKDGEYTLIRSFQASDQMMKLAAWYSQWKLAAQMFGCRRLFIGWIVSANLRLVVSCAKTFRNRGISLSELISEGVHGMIRAAELFDTGTGNKFSTYATNWIKQKMFRALENKVKLLKLPSDMVQDLTKSKKLYFAWTMKYGLPPTSDQLAEEFLRVYKKQVTPDYCRELGQIDWDLKSLDEQMSDDDATGTLGDSVQGDESLQPEAIMEAQADREQILSAFRRLPQPDANLLMLKYGYLDHKHRTDRELAAIYGKSIKEIKDWHYAVMVELRKLLTKDQMTTRYRKKVRLVSCPDKLTAYRVVHRITGLGMSSLSSLPADLGEYDYDVAQELTAELELLGCRVS